MLNTTPQLFSSSLIISYYFVNNERGYYEIVRKMRNGKEENFLGYLGYGSYLFLLLRRDFLLHVLPQIPLSLFFVSFSIVLLSAPQHITSSSSLQTISTRSASQRAASRVRSQSVHPRHPPASLAQQQPLQSQTLASKGSLSPDASLFPFLFLSYALPIVGPCQRNQCTKEPVRFLLKRN